MAVPDFNTIPAVVARGRAEGLPLTAYTVRRLIKQGLIPARFVGSKAIVSYSRIVRYFDCADGCDNPVTGSGERRWEG